MENIASLSAGGPDGPGGPDSGGYMGGLTVPQTLGTSLSKETQGSGDSRDVLRIFLLEGEPDRISVSEGQGDTPPTIEFIGFTPRQRIFEVVTSNLTEDERAHLSAVF